MYSAHYGLIKETGDFVSFIFNFGNLVKRHFKAFMFIADILAMAVAVFVAATLKFDAAIRYQNWFTDYLWAFVLIDVAVTTIIFAVRKIYSRMWQYFVAWDYACLVGAFAVSKTVATALCPFIYLNETYSLRGFLTWVALFSIIEILLIL